jgi:hypothetical protein
LEITATLRGSSDENSAADQPLTYRIKYFLSKGDTLTLRFNDYDVDDEDLNAFYFGDDEDDGEFDEDDLESSDEDEEVIAEEIDLTSDDDDEVEEEIFDIDDDFDDYDDDDDELDDNFLFSVGVQHFKVKDIDWNTITLEYSSEDEDDFRIKE